MGYEQINNALQNRLLAALPADNFAHLKPNIGFISLSLGKFLYESGEQMDYVYFPTTAIISLLYTMESGSTAEIGITEKDGLVGIALFMGGETTPYQAIVQSDGNAFRMKDKDLHNEICARRIFSATSAPIYASIDHTDFTNYCLQSVSSGKQSSCPLVADDARPIGKRRISTDTGIFVEDVMSKA